MAENNRAINRVFTRKVIYDLLQGKQNDVFDYVVRRYVDHPESKKHGELISEIYALLGKQRRNEYYYINTLLNKLLAGIHNVNTTTAFSQVHIGHSIADFVMINGEGCVYEIKSDLDNFSRLKEQLFDYYRAFTKVSVLASVHELTKVKSVLASFGRVGDSVGIYALSGSGTIFSKERSRDPADFSEMLDHVSIFKLLRKREYESVVLSYYGYLPETKPVFYFRTCLELFGKIPILDAQRMACLELKKRNRITINEFNSIKPELKSVIYFSGIVNKLPELSRLLESNYGG